MKIAIVDTYYPDFLKTFQVNEKSTYEAELRRLLDCQFGTFDAYSRSLRKLGWEAVDIIANCEPLQQMWARDNYNHKAGALEWVLARQMERLKPDVVFVQDLRLIDTFNSSNVLLAAQLSCPWPGDERVRQCDVIFTSLPTYVPRIEKLGVRAVYNPLAFEPSVLGGFQAHAHGPVSRRNHGCGFIGGVGNPSHWINGKEVLEAVACDVPGFKWWGYGVETLKGSPLRLVYSGEAWGREMYHRLLHCKIVINRHGEVAEGYSNNMRMFEVTGCGALLVTEESKNIRDFFTDKECVTYSSPQDAVDKIRYYLDHDDERVEIAANGQKRTLSDHTYEKRMATVSDTLQDMLVTA